MQISTELTMTLTSYLPRTLVVTSQTVLVVIILVVKLRKTDSQSKWERLASLSWGTFAILRTRSYQFLNEARSNHRFDLHNNFWLDSLTARVYAAKTRVVYHIHLNWGHLGLVRLINIFKKLHKGLRLVNICKAKNQLLYLVDKAKTCQSVKSCLGVI